MPNALSPSFVCYCYLFDITFPWTDLGLSAISINRRGSGRHYDIANILRNVTIRRHSVRDIIDVNNENEWWFHRYMRNSAKKMRLQLSFPSSWPKFDNQTVTVGFTDHGTLVYRRAVTCVQDLCTRPYQELNWNQTVSDLHARCFDSCYMRTLTLNLTIRPNLQRSGGHKILV